MTSTLNDAPLSAVCRPVAVGAPLPGVDPELPHLAVDLAADLAPDLQ